MRNQLCAGILEQSRGYEPSMNWVVEYRPIHTLAESILGIDSWLLKSMKTTVSIVQSIVGGSDSMWRNQRFQNCRHHLLCVLGKDTLVNTFSTRNNMAAVSSGSNAYLATIPTWSSFLDKKRDIYKPTIHLAEGLQICVRTDGGLIDRWKYLGTSY